VKAQKYKNFFELDNRIVNAGMSLEKIAYKA